MQGMEMILYAAESEKSVLGSIFLEPELIKECPLDHKDFSHGRNANLFWTLRDMDEKGIPIDVDTVLDRVKSKIDKVGGVSYIAEIASGVPTTANFKYHCGIIKEHTRKRNLLTVADTLKETALEDSEEALNNTLSALSTIADEGLEHDDDGSLSDTIVKVYRDAEEADGSVKGIASKYRDIDRYTGGYQLQDLVIVGGRPSMGKTAFVLNVSSNVMSGPHNRYEGDVVAIFSIEMPKDQLIRRMACSMAGIELAKLRTAQVSFTHDDWGKFSAALGTINDSDIKIFDNPAPDVNYIYNKVRKLKQKFPGRKILVIIDYLQLILGDKKHNGNRNNEIGDISRGLKRLARKLNVCVMALSQLSRGVEQRQDKRPMMSDIRESGQIEQDADIIQFLYRDDYYNAESENPNMIEIITAKARNGSTGTATLAFLREIQKFVNIDWGQRRQ